MARVDQNVLMDRGYWWAWTWKHCEMKRWIAGKVVRCEDDITLTCGGPKDDL